MKNNTRGFHLATVHVIIHVQWIMKKFKKIFKDDCLKYLLWYTAIDWLVYIPLDKRGYQVNSFLISPWKHMLWVLIGSTALRPF